VAAMSLDLWTPRFDEDRLHPNFRTILSHGSPEPREVITEWSAGFSDRDGKFVDEFQLTFDSSFWELYLNASFGALGFERRFDHAAPDFELIRLGATTIAEATIASNAGGYRPEWNKQGVIRAPSFDLRQAIRYTATRLSNAIASKSRKYIESYGDLPHVRGCPFVVCVAPFDFPFSFDWSQAALRQVLFALDEPMTETRSDGTKFIVGLSETSEITKDTGADIPAGLFRDKRLSHVSAVLFSSLATFSKVRALSKGPEEWSWFKSVRFNAHGTEPFVEVSQKPEHAESLLDGLILCQNPYATHALDASPFEGREITIETWDIEADEYICEAPHKALIWRFVFTAKPGSTELTEAVPATADEPVYKEFARPKWPDRELRPVAGFVGVGINNHLAHIGDWTAVVFQDSVDKTWHAMAVRLHVYSLPEFRDANGDDGPGSITCPDDHETMQEAFEHICSAIDAEGEAS
jgi:hypothetical protein